MYPPPRHSIQAISAKRVGGKKVPKRYRKYHSEYQKNNGKNNRGGGKGSVVVKATGYIIKIGRAAFEALG